MDQVLHQENRNKGILHLPRRQLRNNSFVLHSVLFTISWKAKGDVGRELAKAEQIETQTLYSKTPSTSHAKPIIPVNAKDPSGLWAGKVKTKLLRKCWKMWHFHFQDVADMLKTPLSAHLAQLELCKNQTFPAIFIFLFFCKSAHYSAAEFSSLDGEGGVRSYHPAVMAPCRNSQKKFLKSLLLKLRF